MKIKSDIVFLYHIRDAIIDIKSFKPSTMQHLSDDRKTKLAICKSFEIVGEASANLTEELKNKYPETPWQRVKDFRNHLTHEYFDVDYEEIWGIMENHLPKLEKEILEIIDNIERNK